MEDSLSVLTMWRGAGAVALCAMPTHDDETVMNGAPGFVVLLAGFAGAGVF
jgi:hypothetical protein